MVDLEHINTTVEVGNVHLCAASDGFAVHLLTNDVEELDVSLLIIAKVDGEVVGGRIRINSGVGFLNFRNVHDSAIAAGNFEVNVGILDILVPNRSGIEIVLEEIVELAKKLPNYEIIRSIPGIADNLASRILAEIGDIDRFNNASQLVAYAGIDPQIYQSGQISGLHLKISKKGNKKLRCLLY